MQTLIFYGIYFLLTKNLAILHQKIYFFALPQEVFQSGIADVCSREENMK